MKHLVGFNRLRKMNVQTPMEVTVSVFRGHQTEGFEDQGPLVSVVVERWYMAPGVCRIPVTEGGLTATLFLPSASGLFPGILDLWGGGGRLVEYRAALLASRGFASLDLDYLTPKITLGTGDRVDTEYFEVNTLITVMTIQPHCYQCNTELDFDKIIICHSDEKENDLEK
ncbi:acyl-coenzyme A thioesterase 1-like [Betta splendens]|uniref:Acyl-coenzyme A thioesterase 1-like n=1 Tax=Betta splendens TaxID=158456 RepID=A0A6P7MR47_BETSP|nr:acyl-coenzyme A thioesterase 1-like [Betta splendens]